VGVTSGENVSNDNVRDDVEYSEIVGFLDDRACVVMTKTDVQKWNGGRRGLGVVS
jgi:hypothetical protein